MLCNKDWWKIAAAVDVQAESDAGADVWPEISLGRHPVYSASYFGTPATIRVLLEDGADATVCYEDGSTPLQLATTCRFSCKPRLITTLLDAGADKKVEDEKGKTPWD